TGVLDGKESGVWRTPEGTRTDERTFGSDGNAGKIRVASSKALAVGIAGEGVKHDGVEVGVASAKKEVVEGLVLQLRLKTLSAKGERIEVWREDGVHDAGRVAEDLYKRTGAYALKLMIEDVVEVAGFEYQLLAEEVLVDAEVVGVGALRAGRDNVIFGNIRLVSDEK